MSNPSLQENFSVIRHGLRYMHFNNNLNWTYRHIPFEKTVVKLMIKDLDKNITVLIPSKFAVLAAFILSYGHTPQHKYVFPEFIVQKLEEMKEQLTVLDCLLLTRGMQIALRMRFS